MTAVEWLQEQLKKRVDFNPLDKNSYLNNVEKLFQQAKEMEKQQMIDFGNNCIMENSCVFDIEQYYNETFKSE
jgi:hypothetical protein